ncbi:GumC family protein [Mucilaginibacter sp. UYCu711]|uniref:GumC family protein n=1 Tax=Mucilaginibacter sp. UYCu711 TaxID=3156339 RepID=UPI003D242296
MIENETFNLREIFKKVLFHWPLFCTFLIISFIIAYFYLQFTQPLYVVEAKILIKDQKNKASEGAALQELNMSGSSKGVDTEMGLMTSIPNIEQVVVDLQLWVNYRELTPYYSVKDIYDRTPLKFKLLKAGKPLSQETFDITIIDEDSFLITGSDRKQRKLLFKSEFTNDFGTWKLDTTRYLKSYIGKSIQIHLENIKDVVRQYQNKIDVENFVKTNPTIDLSIIDEVPERGRAILNDLLRVYTAASVEDKRRSTQSTLDFLEVRLNSLTAELNGIESNYEGYKSARGITEISAESTKYLANQQNTDTKLNDINIQLSVIEGIEQYVNSDRGEDNPPATIGMNDPGLIGLIKQLTDLQSQKIRLLATLPETNPLFTPIDQQIKAAKIAIKENLKGIKASLIRTRTQLQGLGASYQSSIQNIPTHERELVDIKRMQGIKENLYIYLLQKKEEIGLDYASTISDDRIEEQPHYGNPKSPIPKQAYAIAFLAGILLPAGLVFGRTAIRNTVLTRNEILRKTGVPVLTEINLEPGLTGIVVVNSKTFIGEQFRSLRTKINFLGGKESAGKVILVTSSVSGEGKSFISSNLGATLAVSGKKTIVLELDLRKPMYSEIFGLDKNKPGITDYLIGKASKNEIIQRIAIVDNLFLIDCGIIPPNPSELLQSKELNLFIDELRKEYDYVILDTPPAHLVTDSTILAPITDISLFVIRQDYTSKNELQFINDLAIGKTFPRMNIVFNGTQNEKHGYGYGYDNNSYYIQSPLKLKSKMQRFFSRF